MQKISQDEFRGILEGIIADKDSIISHNPIGSREETLLWMLLSTLVVYLSLDESESPCFPGRADAETYRTAIKYILNDRKTEKFDVEDLLDKLKGQ